MFTRRGQVEQALTRIPFDDSMVDALPDELRRALAAHWLRRARSEARVGLAFGQMVPRLDAVGADAVVLELLASSARDEAMHAELCHRLAERYAGESIAAPVALSAPLPVFGCDDERLEAALLVAGLCCVNETLATAWLEASLRAARTKLSRAANRVHLRDEIDHARLGWAHLASAAVDEPMRDALAECVPRLLAANLPGWFAPDSELGVNGAPDHGIIALADARSAVLEAVRAVVLPGFEHVGVRLDASALTATETLLGQPDARTEQPWL